MQANRTPTPTLEQVPVVVLWHVNDAHMHKLVTQFQDVRLVAAARVTDEPALPAVEHPFTSRSVWSDTGVTEDGRMFAASNAQRFQRFTRAEEGYGDGGCCYHCREEFTHEAMGVPITLRQIDADLVVVYMYDVLCSFECAYAWITYLRASYSAPTDLDEAERLLKFLYVLQYPDDAVLQLAPPFRLAPGYEGPLTTAQYWACKRHMFRLQPSVILAPARILYVAPKTTAVPVPSQPPL